MRGRALVIRESGRTAAGAARAVFDHDRTIESDAQLVGDQCTAVSGAILADYRRHVSNPVDLLTGRERERFLAELRVNAGTSFSNADSRGAGTGIDTVRSTVSHALAVNVENLHGTSFADQITLSEVEGMARGAGASILMSMRSASGPERRER